MEFLEAYKCAKKYRTSFRLPGMNYILIPKKKDDKDTITVGYRSEEFEVSRSSWDLLRRSMTKSLTE